MYNYTWKITYDIKRGNTSTRDIVRTVNIEITRTLHVKDEIKIICMSHIHVKRNMSKP